MTIPRAAVLDSQLDRLCEIPGIVHAAAVSSDGMLIARSRGLARDSADQIAAFTSGLEAITRGMATLMQAGSVEHTSVEMGSGRVVVMAISDGSILTVLAAADADMGQVAYEMALLTNAVGAALTPELRTPQQV